MRRHDPARQSPHAISFAAALIAIAIFGFVQGVPSTSLEAALAPFQAVGLSILALVGGTLVIVGGYWRRTLFWALQFERAGHALIATGALVYVFTIASALTPGRGGLAFALAVGLLVGSVWRAVRITRHDLRIVRMAEGR